MKTCPVCKAQAFDDAEVCYGCLYRFEWNNTQQSSCYVLDDNDVDILDNVAFEDPEPPRLEPSIVNMPVASQAQPVLTVPAHTVVSQARRMSEELTSNIPATLVIQLQIQHSFADSCLAQ